MRRWASSGLAATAIAMTMVVAGSLSMAESTGEGLIKYRQSLMSAMGGHMGAIARIVRGEADFPDQLAAHAQAVDAIAQMIPEAFAEAGSDADTKALPLIWEDHDGFIAKVDALQTAAADFAAAADGGDIAAAGAALGPLGSACQGCHETYRAR